MRAALNQPAALPIPAALVLGSVRAGVQAQRRQLSKRLQKTQAWCDLVLKNDQRQLKVLDVNGDLSGFREAALYPGDDTHVSGVVHLLRWNKILPQYDALIPARLMLVSIEAMVLTAVSFKMISIQIS